MSIDRRQFLRSATATTMSVTAGSLAAGSITGALSGIGANASTTNGYKALVCVFFFGGLDNHDIVLPYDETSYNSFAQIRAPLLARQGANRFRTSLLPLNPDNAGAFAGRQFALPPEMPQLKALFDQRRAAIIANVGPLIAPTTRQQLDNDSAIVPVRLFSHNDQQSTWQASAPEGAQFGWGGLFADAAINSNANGSPEFTAVSIGGSDLFLTGQKAQPYQVSPGGASKIDLLETLDPAVGLTGNLRALLEAQYRGEPFTGNNLIRSDIRNKLRDAMDSNDAFDAALSSAPAIASKFPQTPLGERLQVIAQTIGLRSRLDANRQIFFVGLGGFDTHSGQSQILSRLQSQIDDALAAFYQSTIDMGVQNDVTLFTASDFGRTLAVNGDGTDHGWGGHHFVLGGAVNGRTIYGDVPPPLFDHEQDAEGGRLIPTTSVEQFAAPLGRWFGLSESELAISLPRLANFSAPSLNFI